MERLPNFYIEKIVSFHGIPSSIVSDRDQSFHSSIRMTPFEALYGRRCRTPLSWYEFGESVVVGLEIVQQNTDKIKLIREKIKISQIRLKSYHDKRRKALEFEKDDHVFLRVTPINERVGEVAYRIALPPSLSNIHDVFHVSKLRKYIADPSHVVQLDDVEVRDNFTVETLPMRIEDREVKQIRGKEIALVKVVWGGRLEEM
ncbi:uncharacterized protein LOC131639499 [Vicia villosa]|uniref:uncharacterized protein LOC131639499 n=1 Tax=Vicia villosa TaxID=3911 RepID=UPI00273AFBA6|nr:uncharacterized protein LOC131639499 [Vicia villosa]